MGSSEICLLPHKETSEDLHGNLVILREGMVLTAFDEDLDENGNRDDLIASGIVERSPEWPRCIRFRGFSGSTKTVFAMTQICNRESSPHSARYITYAST